LNDRFPCVHAHFYQPPRENPWLEAVEVQDSAYPYHDWNERITAECYAPNAACRILDGEGRIVDITNNYAKISFNFGPTLLAWLEEKAPGVYASIQSADKLSRDQHHGHGSAISQAYNHMILPLANARDKHTQVVWGIRDFERRFGRSPEGMWLPEAAVNLDSLEALASNGIKFTILSPHSAHMVRRIGEEEWHEVSDGRIDPSVAYKVHLESGKDIAVFFYDGPVSRGIAFENLLENGETFANRLMSIFSDSRDWPQLAHIATDGETYGHHKPHGDMALAYALRFIEENKLAILTNYSEFLEQHPPTHEARIFNNSSWSCAHGVERWRSNCGCNSGMHAGWNQNWRAPLREAMDWLRDALIPTYEQQGHEVFQDPWRARDEYIRVILDRSPKNVCDFLRQVSGRALSPDEKLRALKLLELQRHAMLMYTSCGWFFDELSGLETVQAIQYAARAVQLASQLTGNANLETEFVERLARAKSNIPENQDGKHVYEQFVKPVMLDLKGVGAHFAVSSLFSDAGSEQHIYCYTISQRDFRTLSSGKTRLVLGHARISSDITTESADISFGVVHLGDHNIAGGVREFAGEEAYQSTKKEITEAFERGDFAELVRVVDKAYGSGSYTLKFLFRDEQRKIVNQILDSALEEAEHVYRQLYTNRAPLMRFVTALGMPPIRRFQVAAEFTLNSDILKTIESGNLNIQEMQTLLDEAKRTGVPLDGTTLEFALRKKLQSMAAQFHANSQDLNLLEALYAAVCVANTAPFRVHYWTVQNIYFDILKNVYPQIRDRKADPPIDFEKWLALFRSLGARLSIRVD
jgi:alpha-amylase/alpha-mannosidase (GH57 family)